MNEPNELEQSLYEQRVLVFMEDIEKGVFLRVLLDAKQFKAVSDAIIVHKEKSPDLRDGMERTWTDLDDDVQLPADLFIGMESITDKSDFEADRIETQTL